MPNDTLEKSFETALARHRDGDLEGAVAAYRALLDDRADYGPALLNMGQALRRLGREEEAIECYERATELPDAAGGAWYNLGNLHLARRQFEVAESAFGKSIELTPDLAPAHFQLGCVFRDQGRSHDAISHFEQAATIDPKLHAAAMNLGNSLRAVGRLEDALAAHRRALELAPEAWEVQYNLARTLDEMADPGADTHFEKALAAAPDRGRVHQGFAAALTARGDFGRAEKHYRAAIAAGPDRLRLLIGLGRTLMRLDRRAEALAVFDDLIQKAGRDVVLLSELATAEWGLKLREEPIAVLRRIVQILPNNADAHVNLARALAGVWEIGEAVDCAQRALEIEPGRRDALTLRGYNLVEMGRVEEGLAIFEAAGADRPADASRLFASLYSDRLTTEELAALHRREGERWHETDSMPHENSPDPERRLRVGYLSPDFKGNHPVAIFLKPVLAHHDRNQISVTCYSAPDYVDETTLAIRELADEWHEVGNWTDARLARQIREDGIDIMVDLAGLTAKTRIGALRGRPAPVQACYIGYVHSTGLPFIDYLIADHVVAPPGSESLFVEKALCVDDCVFCYDPEEDLPDVGLEIARGRPEIVFGSCNHVPKLTETTIDLWAEILRGVPKSRLKLKAAPFADRAVRERYWSLFEARDVARSRIDLDGPSEYREFMAHYQHIDIALDPVPYNGGTTTYQALWMGAPVVTLAGANFCSRMSASFLGNLGLNELIAETPEEYVEIATGLANDRDRVLDLRAGMRDRMRAAPCCDPARFTRNLESLYRDIWRDWCARRQ